MICPSCHAENVSGTLFCSACGDSLALLRPGLVIASRYVVLAPLGQGGMGTVYAARDRVLDEDVALKIVRADRATPHAERRFRSEIKLARRVSHPNVCRIHEYGELADAGPGAGYISMELVDGVDLKCLLRHHGALPLAAAFAVAEQLLDGMQAIHDVGIIHRDLKPSNVMLDVRGVVRVMDFGVAKQGRSDGEESLTSTGHLVGTPEYMSPEQARGESLDPRGDIYTAAVVLFEVFTGRVMFAGKSPVEVILRHIHETPPLESPIAAAVPGRVRAVLARALAKAPGDRYATAREMKDDLGAARLDAGASEDGAPRTLLTELVRPFARARRLTETPAAGAATTPMDRRSSTTPWLALSAVVARRRWAVFGPLAASVLAAAAIAAWRSPATDGSRATPAPTASPFVPEVSPTAPPAHAEARSPSRPPTKQGPGTRSPTAVAALTPPPPATPSAATPSAGELPSRPPSDATIRALVRALGDPGLRKNAAAELTASGMAAVPALTEALNSADELIQSGASELLAQMGFSVGTLKVRILPWAEVAVDGRRVGTTPLRPLRLLAGEHWIRLQHPSHAAHERLVTVSPGALTVLEVDLRREAVAQPPR